jgi:TolB-like protein
VASGIFVARKSAYNSRVTSASIAALPFVDMSPQHDHEYFSDGVAQEIINSLAQVPELHVVARSSSFSFKGKNEDLRSIGEKLEVANVLEGSVRKAGGRLRVVPSWSTQPTATNSGRKPSIATWPTSSRCRTRLPKRWLQR